jgi:hypothetical protein
MEAVVRGMEYFGSRPETPKDECLRIVRGCRAYIGIFAIRYGSIDPETGKSFAQLEYEEAQRIGLPSLIYLIDEERQPILPSHVVAKVLPPPASRCGRRYKTGALSNRAS